MSLSVVDPSVAPSPLAEKQKPAPLCPACVASSSGGPAVALPSLTLATTKRHGSVCVKAHAFASEWRLLKSKWAEKMKGVNMQEFLGILEEALDHLVGLLGHLKPLLL